MSKSFPIVADAVQLGTAAPSATDNWSNGILLNELDTLARAALAGGTAVSSGLLMTDLGQVVYLDATAGLPADTQYTNGLPMSGGALCVSTAAAANYSNGIPFSPNGAVTAVVVP